MKKVLVLGTVFIVAFIFCLLGAGTGNLFADEVEIYHVYSIRGAGPPKYLDAPLDVVVRGNYAYVVSYFDNAFTIFDISNPSNPVHTDAVSGIGPPYRLYGPYSVFLQGNYAYIASHSNNALTIFDISNPYDIVHTGSIESWAGQDEYCWLYGSNDVFVCGNYAYIAARHDDALTIIDVSNPYNPTFVSSIHGAGPPYYLDGASTVYVQGDYAYVTASYDASLSIFNIHNPNNPSYVGSIQGTGTANFTDSQMDAWVVGDYAYVVMMHNATFSVVDVSNPANPYERGSITHDDYYVWLGGAYSVMVQDNYAYVGGRTKDSLVVINISDPDNPVHKKSIRGQAIEGSPYCISGASGIYVVDNLVYLTGPNDDSLSIFDIDITSDAEISVSPEYNFFEGVSGGSSGSETFTITNEGPGDLEVGSITIGGNDANRFSITQDNASNQSIPSGQSATVTVSFNPNNNSSKHAVMSIPSNDVDENPLEVILTGGQTVEDFVSRFYTISLGRPPDPQGLDYWGNLLASGQSTGEDAGYGFIMSDEYIGKGTSNTEFVTMLYNVFLDRNPDGDGLAFWVGQLETMATRAGVLNGFIHSGEFEGICSSYGITAYKTGIPGFVARFYNLALERMPDTEGLEYWVGQLETGALTGEDIAYNFIFSDEFLAYNHPDSTYVSILYNAFFDRVPDPDSYVYWMAMLGAGYSREYVMDNFIHSDEFAGVCAGYGITPY